MRHQILTALLLAAGTANASSPSGFGLEVLVDGRERPEYAARGTVYVEALRGRDYALRLSNPTGTRVAVALSVDGLNTIDSKQHLGPRCPQVGPRPLRDRGHSGLAGLERGVA